MKIKEIINSQKIMKTNNKHHGKNHKQWKDKQQSTTQYLEKQKTWATWTQQENENDMADV